MVKMCPNRQILSVYFDNELDSPWKEKLEKHMEACPSCRDQLAAYRFTREKLAGEASGLEEAMERVWVKTGFIHKPKRRFWAGSIRVPVPVAAAAGLIMVLALAALIAFRQPVQVYEPPLAGMEVQEMIPASDMTSLFQYLGSASSADMVIIRLPDTTFNKFGEPQMLRAADYSRGSGSR
jgi:hypothetical protein